MIDLHLGFTGARGGMALSQRRELRRELKLAVAEYGEGNVAFHHGDCVGADEQAHRIAEIAGCYIIVHPPTYERWRAFCTGDEILPAKDFILRNRDIVQASSHLYAGPDGPRKPRSGTWSTIDYAARLNVPCTQLQILPD